MSDLNALSFLRGYVAANVPLIITDAFDHWPALKKWNLQYLHDVLKDEEVSVSITPNGRGEFSSSDQTNIPAIMSFNQIKSRRCCRIRALCSPTREKDKVFRVFESLPRVESRATRVVRVLHPSTDLLLLFALFRQKKEEDR